MTQPGKKNHYNVKILKGYGFSVAVKDSKIVLRNCYDPFAKPEIEEWYVNNMPYEKIVLSGKGYISTEALSLLSIHNRNVILVDTYGKPVTFLNPVMESLTATKYRMAQYDTLRIKSKRDYLALTNLKTKIDSQVNHVASLGQYEATARMREIRKELDHNMVLIDFERRAAKSYWSVLAKCIPERYGFVSRTQSFIRGTKNNATDVINALLNYGYAVLAGEISKFINGIGLDAYFGFMHKTHTGFQPLVYDMMESFRWLVESAVVKLANSQSNTFVIKKKDFAHTREGNIVLGYDLIRRFLEMLERTFQKERRYVFKHGVKTTDGKKNVQEITIAKIAVQNLADYCLGKSNTFFI